MPNRAELLGKTFGRLNVIADLGTDPVRGAKWLCKCKCGNEIVTYSGPLISGHTQSCGCKMREISAEKLRKYSTTHGKSKTRLYRIWSNMKDRCYRKESTCYARYGGRGIQICNEWRENFESFYNWAVANGYQDNLTIDRITVNGNYCPDNYRWANHKTQCNNRRSNRTFTILGETHTLMEWCEKYEAPYGRVKQRLFKLGWDIEHALTQPPLKSRWDHTWE